jgi:putative FmdB family regulatory protein
MPLFDFHCKKCDSDFELLMRGSDIPVCPECGSEEVEKQVSMPAAPSKTAGVIANARAQAAREGHFSNYAPSERPKRK